MSITSSSTATTSQKVDISTSSTSVFPKGSPLASTTHTPRVSTAMATATESAASSLPSVATNGSASSSALPAPPSEDSVLHPSSPSSTRKLNGTANNATDNFAESSSSFDKVFEDKKLNEMAPGKLSEPSSPKESPSSSSAIRADSIDHADTAITVPPPPNFDLADENKDNNTPLQPPDDINESENEFSSNQIPPLSPIDNDLPVVDHDDIRGSDFPTKPPSTSSLSSLSSSDLEDDDNDDSFLPKDISREISSKEVDDLLDISMPDMNTSDLSDPIDSEAETERLGAAELQELDQIEIEHRQNTMSLVSTSGVDPEVDIDDDALSPIPTKGSVAGFADVDGDLSMDDDDDDGEPLSPPPPELSDQESRSESPSKKRRHSPTSKPTKKIKIADDDSEDETALYTKTKDDRVVAKSLPEQSSTSISSPVPSLSATSSQTTTSTADQSAENTKRYKAIDELENISTGSIAGEKVPDTEGDSNIAASSTNQSESDKPTRDSSIIDLHDVEKGSTTEDLISEKLKHGDNDASEAVPKQKSSISHTDDETIIGNGRPSAPDTSAQIDASSSNYQYSNSKDADEYDSRKINHNDANMPTGETDDSETVKKPTDEEILAAQQAERKEALSMLTEIEIEFAKLRDQLHSNKMTRYLAEIEMCAEGTHPELEKACNDIQSVRNERVKRAELRRKYQRINIDIQTRASREQLHQQFLKDRSDIRAKLLLNTTEEWYRVNRERRLMDSMVPEFGFRPSTDPVLQGREFQSYNNEVRLLTGISQNYGFPAAPAMRPSSEAEIQEDLQLFASLDPARTSTEALYFRQNGGTVVPQSVNDVNHAIMAAPGGIPQGLEPALQQQPFGVPPPQTNGHYPRRRVNHFVPHQHHYHHHHQHTNY